MVSNLTYFILQSAFIHSCGIAKGIHSNFFGCQQDRRKPWQSSFKEISFINKLKKKFNKKRTLKIRIFDFRCGCKTGAGKAVPHRFLSCRLKNTNFEEGNSYRAAIHSPKLLSMLAFILVTDNVIKISCGIIIHTALL